MSGCRVGLIDTLWILQTVKLTVRFRFFHCDVGARESMFDGERFHTDTV